MELINIKTGKYIVAVSGGVDSVVLLDLLSRQKNLELVVAHFDHGIRKESKKDAQFVEELAAKYNLPFISKEEKLGEAASEEAARSARYTFLEAARTKQKAVAIITAHHADDVLETMIINILRGTGWRGISALRSEKTIIRPLLHLQKDELYNYAKQRSLLWCEDETNTDEKYLRNYVRLNITSKLSLSEKQRFLKLHDGQVDLQKEMNEEAKKLLEVSEVKRSEYSRYFFISIDEATAIELLKYLTRATYPQLKAGLLAIKTAKANTIYQIGGGVELAFTKKTFIVVHPDNVVS